MTNKHWEIVGKSSRGGSQYKQYWDDLCVFIPKTAEGVRAHGFVLTPKVKEALGNPSHVMILRDGSLIGFAAASGNNSNAYAVTGKERTARVGCGTFITENIGVFPCTVRFDCIMDGDIVVLDMSDPQRMINEG